MKIIIGAGGSGGHVFPALETAKALANEKHQVIFLTTEGLAFDLVRKYQFPVWIVASPRMKLSSPMSAIQEGLKMLRAIYQAYYLIEDIRPDVVVGFGGYGAFPVVTAAILKRKPTLIHDQNVVPSWSNRVLKGFVNKIAISFEKSQDHFRSPRTVLTGCPCRDDPSPKTKEQIYHDFKLSPGRQTIFVLGGSQGSRKINQEFSQAVELLRTKIDFQFIHVCGRADYAMLQNQYRSLTIPYQLFDFLDDVQSAYSIADLVVARSGAATVCEILSFQKRAILIPYPLIRVHQKENAEVVCAQGLGVIMDDKDCCSQRLADEITSQLRKKEEKRCSAASDRHEEKPAQRIAKEIIRLIS
jgi:UDP-N-acetylglucosamine--N-acetylmuramyl-(pentapeptide) pyrophosphoryl-undecaprenol N-acetylglucosamine transferase